jgi:hypothetical protein
MTLVSGATIALFLYGVFGPNPINVQVYISPSAYAPGAMVYGTPWRSSYKELTVSIDNPTDRQYPDFEGHIQVNNIQPIVWKEISNVIGFDLQVDEPPKWPAIFRYGWQVTPGNTHQFNPMFSFRRDRLRRGPPFQFVVIFDPLTPEHAAAVTAQCANIKREDAAAACDSEFSVTGFVEFAGLFGRVVHHEIGKKLKGDLIREPIFVVPDSKRR